MSDVPPLPSDEESVRDSVQKFAADLRHLRLDADSPTLARLQSETGISKSVLSEAFAGRQVPSARTVDGLVRALEGDSRAWLTRRDALLSPPAPLVSDVPVVADAAPSRLVTRRATSWIAAAAFLLGIIVSAAVTLALVPVVYPPEAAGPDGPSARITVETGANPALTECVDDARVATSDTRTDNSLLEIVWSDACQAGWGRVTRYDGLANGNAVTIAIYPQTSPTGPDRQEATEHDVQGAYTMLVVRPSPDTLLCAEGSFTIDGKRIDLGDPICI